jgi:GlpG protein
MRLIGHLPEEPPARVFGDWLYVQGIENQVEQDESGWGIWIVDEDRIPDAMLKLETFRMDPGNPAFKEQAKGADALRAEAAKGQQQWERRLRDRRHLFRPLRDYGFGPLTYGLIVLSVIVFLLSKFGNNPEAVSGLFITRIEYLDDAIRYQPSLPEIRHGQIWRLFTPMLVHFSILHILFNMLWLKDLGSMVEGRQSTLFLAVFVLVTAGVSNLAQYYWSGPSFGGMSGVVYALLGYIWLRGKFDPGSGLFLHQSTVIMMIIWFLAGVLQLLGPIANLAHGAGLAMGMAWGYLASRRYRR